MPNSVPQLVMSTPTPKGKSLSAGVRLSLVWDPCCPMPSSVYSWGPQSDVLKITANNRGVLSLAWTPAGSCGTPAGHRKLLLDKEGAFRDKTINKHITKVSFACYYSNARQVKARCPFSLLRELSFWKHGVKYFHYHPCPVFPLPSLPLLINFTIVCC